MDRWKNRRYQDESCTFIHIYVRTFRFCIAVIIILEPYHLSLFVTRRSTEMTHARSINNHGSTNLIYSHFSFHPPHSPHSSSFPPRNDYVPSVERNNRPVNFAIFLFQPLSFPPSCEILSLHVFALPSSTPSLRLSLFSSPATPTVTRIPAL